MKSQPGNCQVIGHFNTHFLVVVPETKTWNSTLLELHLLRQHN